LELFRVGVDGLVVASEKHASVVGAMHPSELCECEAGAGVWNVDVWGGLRKMWCWRLCERVGSRHGVWETLLIVLVDFWHVGGGKVLERWRVRGVGQVYDL
jgi:hypothetical protein